MTFGSLDDLAGVGLDGGSVGQPSYVEKDREYPRTQEIAEACCFLGADGLLVASARNPVEKNLIIFCDQDTAIVKDVVRNHGPIDRKAA
jgi:hypothetical protein